MAGAAEAQFPRLGAPARFSTIFPLAGVGLGNGARGCARRLQARIVHGNLCLFALRVTHLADADSCRTPDLSLIRLP